MNSNGIGAMVLIACLSFVAGCATTGGSRLNFADFYSKPEIEIYGSDYVAVTACNRKVNIDDPEQLLLAVMGGYTHISETRERESYTYLCVKFTCTDGVNRMFYVDAGDYHSYLIGAMDDGEFLDAVVVYEF